MWLLSRIKREELQYSVDYIHDGWDDDVVIPIRSGSYRRETVITPHYSPWGSKGKGGREGIGWRGSFDILRIAAGEG